MKKIYLRESQIGKELLLPQFLYQAVKFHKTSLGDNPAFPGEDDHAFDYTVLKDRFKDLCAQMNDIGVPLGNTEDLLSYLSKLVVKCKELEKPIKDSLEKLCENAVNRLFAIPDGEINFMCKLVDKVKYEVDIAVTPESSGAKKYKFKDIADFDLSKKAIAKRRLINSLIMGAAEYYSSMKSLYIEDLNKLNPELSDLYDKIMIINSYLNFITKEEMTDDKPKQGSFVEVHVGFNGKKSTINAQGIIFPLMLHDAIKGFFELFSVYGLPTDPEKAKHIVSKADFLLAEPWDMRFGVQLWKMIFDKMELADNTNIIPYIFTYIALLPFDEFNSTMKELFMGTEKGDEILSGFIERSKRNDAYRKFKNRVNARNMDRAVIADSYFTASELDGYNIDGGDDADVIEENDVEELRAYHGSSADFDKFNHKKYLNTGAESQAFGWGTYITSDKKIGESYANIKSNDVIYMFNDWKDEGYSDNEIIWGNSDKFFNDFLENTRYSFSRYNLTEEEIYESAKMLFNMLKGNNFRKKVTYDLIESFIHTPNNDDERYYFKLKAMRGVLGNIPAMERTDILYEVDIPDDTGFNYVGWYEHFPKEFMTRVLKGMLSIHMKYLHKMAVNDEPFRIGLYERLLWMRREENDEDYEINNLVGNEAYQLFFGNPIIKNDGRAHFYNTKSEATGEWVYRRLEKLMGSHKAASLFLMHCGFDGIKYPAGTLWNKPDGAAEDAYNYVIFDANKVKIVNKARV